MTNTTKTILVVDDDPEIRDSLEVILESGGYQVRTAASAVEGLRAYQAEKPDLLLLDLMMEEIDSGTNLTQALKAQGADVPIYILSSAGDTLYMAVDYQELGVSGVLQKPIKPDHLLGLLASKFAES